MLNFDDLPPLDSHYEVRRAQLLCDTTAEYEKLKSLARPEYWDQQFTPSFLLENMEADRHSRLATLEREIASRPQVVTSNYESSRRNWGSDISPPSYGCDFAGNDYQEGDVDECGCPVTLL